MNIQCFLRLGPLLISIAIGAITCGCSSNIPTKSAFRENFKSWNELKWENIERQQYDYSCGASSLATMLKSYFEEPAWEGLVMTVLVSQLTPEGLADRQKNGFSLLDLKFAANKLGYGAEGVKLRADMLDKLNGPVIILIHQDDMNHFAILKGIYADRAYLADSSRGNIRVPLYQLAQQWDGVALVLGKDGFGLPSDHTLSPHPGIDYRPEQTLLRSIYASDHK